MAAVAGVLVLGGSRFGMARRCCCTPWLHHCSVKCRQAISMCPTLCPHSAHTLLTLCSHSALPAVRAVQARELEELAQIYVARGLPYSLALQVAQVLTDKDVIRAHARDELGIE